MTVIQAASGEASSAGHCAGRAASRARGAIVCAVPATAHDLALRYLLELSADIRGALLLDRDGRLLASAGHLAAGDLAAVGERLAAGARALRRTAGADADWAKPRSRSTCTATGGACSCWARPGT